MRSAEVPAGMTVHSTLVRRFAVAASMSCLLATLAGCADMAAPIDAIKRAMAGRAAGAASAPATTSATTAAVKAPAASASAASTADVGPPIDPRTQRAYDDARRLMKAGRADEAERAFTAIAKANPELAGPHANLGALYRQRGALADAVRELETAARLSPTQPAIQNQLGIAYRSNGQFDKARTAYEQALSGDPTYAPAVLNLGILNDLYLGDAARATELYERYLALTPGGDAAVTKWLADLRNRKAKAAQSTTPASSTTAPAAPAGAKEKS